MKAISAYWIVDSYGRKDIFVHSSLSDGLQRHHARWIANRAKNALAPAPYTVQKTAPERIQSRENPSNCSTWRLLSNQWSLACLLWWFNQRQYHYGNFSFKTSKKNSGLSFSLRCTSICWRGRQSKKHFSPWPIHSAENFSRADSEPLIPVKL